MLYSREGLRHFAASMKPVVIDLSSSSPVLPRFPEYGIGISESRHSQAFTMEPSQYDFHEVMLVLNGAGWAVHAGVRLPLRKNEAITVPAGSYYHLEDRKAKPLSILCLCIRPPTPWQALFNEVLPKRFAVVRHQGMSAAIASHLRMILYEQSQGMPGEAAVVTGRTLELLSTLLRRAPGQFPAPPIVSPGNNPEVYIRDYIEKLQTNFHEPETLTMAAERLGVSARTLSSYFRKITGCSRLQYLQELRLSHARHLLSSTRQPITSIAFACGFEELSTFFRAFRAREKCSPSQWREQHVGTW